MMSPDPGTALMGAGQAAGGTISEAQRIKQRSRMKTELKRQQRSEQARQRGAQRKGFTAAVSLLKAISE